MAEVGLVLSTPSFEQIVAEDERDIKQEMRLNTARHAALAERIIVAEAPRDTGELARSVTKRQNRTHLGRFSTGFQIVGGAAREGFPYLNVTRFGHKAAFVFPKRSRSLAVHSEGRHHPPVRRRFVRGYHPARDWVEVGVTRATRAIMRVG